MAGAFRLPTVPSALRYRQEEYGWNQSQMADKLGLARSHYSDILLGKRILPYKAACRAYELGVPAAVLLSLENRIRVAAP